MRNLFGYDSRCFAHSATYLDPAAAAGFYYSDSLGEGRVADLLGPSYLRIAALQHRSIAAAQQRSAGAEPLPPGQVQLSSRTFDHNRQALVLRGKAEVARERRVGPRSSPLSTKPRIAPSLVS